VIGQRRLTVKTAPACPESVSFNGSCHLVAELGLFKMPSLSPYRRDAACRTQGPILVVRIQRVEGLPFNLLNGFPGPELFHDLGLEQTDAGFRERVIK